MRALVVLAMVVALAGCGGSSSPPPAASPFPVGPRPLDMLDGGAVQAKSPLNVRNISFAGPGGRVPGFLVLPPGRPRGRPAVLLLHGTGGDRGEFLPLAEWIAARGAVALTITEPSSSAPPPPPGEGAEAQLRRDRSIASADVVAARRAVRVLARRPEVDPARIGLVGWSAGAKTGAILAGVEPQLHALALMSGGAFPVEEYAAAAPQALRPAIRRELAPVDPLHWIARGRPGTIFLQDGRRDQIVPRRALDTLAAAAPKGTRFRWYDGGHGLNVAAEHDQLVWLAARLGIRGPRVAGAPIGP
jgi:hypothetical protein